MCKPKEIIINEKVKNAPVVKSILEKYQDVPVEYVKDNNAETIINASDIIKDTGKRVLEEIKAEKQILYIAPLDAGSLNPFQLPYDRISCSEYDRSQLGLYDCPYYRGFLKILCHGLIHRTYIDI